MALKKENKRVTFDMPKELHKKLSKEAKRHHMSRSQYLRLVLSMSLASSKEVFRR